MNISLDSIHRILQEHLPNTISDLSQMTDDSYSDLIQDLLTLHTVALQALDRHLEDVRDTEFISLDTHIHGPEHWFRVFFYGCILLYYHGIEDAEMYKAHLLGAYSHDTCRVHDKRCKVHGVIASEHVADIAALLGIANEYIDAVALGVMIHCTSVGHPRSKLEFPLTTKIICDSDRLDRIRVGRRADSSFLFQDLSKELNELRHGEEFLVEKIFNMCSS